MAASTNQEAEAFQAAAPVIVFGRQIPFLYAEPDVHVARQHLAKHLGDGDRFRVQHHAAYDGWFREMTPVADGTQITFVPAGPSAPQPERLREALGQMVALIQRSLDDVERRQPAPLTPAEVGALRAALADIDPGADLTDAGLSALLDLLARRMSTDPDGFRTLPHPGSRLHNLVHKLSDLF